MSHSHRHCRRQPPPHPDSVSDRGQEGVVFSRSRRGGQPCTCSRIFCVAVCISIFCLLLWVFSIMWMLCPCIRGESYYPGAQNTCTCVSALLLKNGGRLMLRLSLICLVILNFAILKLVLTSKFCSQEYKFTLFLSVPTLPSQASFSSRLCWGEKKIKTAAKKLGMKRKE